MHDAPALPDPKSADDLLTGHLWVQEFVDGTPFRFQVQSAAPIQFGDERREYDASDAPPALRAALHHVQRRLDRTALRAAVADVEAVTFCGVATHARRVEYDWPRLPAFLGMDVWDDEHGAFLPPDRVEQVYETLGLSPVNALAKEVRASDFDPTRYEFPDSAWRDDPVAGVVVRDKTGGRGRLLNPDVVPDDENEGSGVETANAAPPDDTSPEGLAAAYATRDRYDRTAREIIGGNGTGDRSASEADALSFDSLQKRVLDGIYREYAPIFEGLSVDHGAFRRAVAERTSEYLGGRA